MARLILDTGLTNAFLVENLGATSAWHQIPLGRSEWKPASNWRLVMANTSTSFATNSTVFTNSAAGVWWLDLARVGSGASTFSTTAFVVRSNAGYPASDLPALAGRYGVVALFMLLGAVLVLCYQGGRKGGR